MKYKDSETMISIEKRHIKAFNIALKEADKENKCEILSVEIKTEGSSIAFVNLIYKGEDNPNIFFFHLGRRYEFLKNVQLNPVKT